MQHLPLNFLYKFYKTHWKSNHIYAILIPIKYLKLDAMR